MHERIKEYFIILLVGASGCEIQDMRTGNENKFIRRVADLCMAEIPHRIIKQTIVVQEDNLSMTDLLHTYGEDLGQGYPIKRPRRAKRAPKVRG